jgi:hypothetical protein
MHSDFGGGGSFGGHDFGGAHHVGGSHHVSGGHQHHRAGDRSGDGQVIPLYRDEARRPGQRVLVRAKGAWGSIGDGIIILIAVFAVVGIASLIFH